MEVTSRELICGPLPALKDNRAEAEQREAELLNGALNGSSAAAYQPGLYTMMDWVVARLHKAGAAAWALIFPAEEYFSAVEFDCLFAISAWLA